ncbi:MAG: hypothetical protein JJE23_08815 [Thermoleophilia bacterium]|nr:hypothetical protein [Thermoleophilia bacterium]
MAELIGAGGGEAAVDVSGLGASAPGEFYALWLLTSPDDLVSLGSFKVDEHPASLSSKSRSLAGSPCSVSTALKPFFSSTQAETRFSAATPAASERIGA